MKNRHNKNKKKQDWFPQPAKKKIYEMPEDYKHYLEQLTGMLDESEEYKKWLPLLSPKERDEALSALRGFDKNIDALEQKLADTYNAFQKGGEENEKHKGEARARLYEYMQRMFILAKHKFPADKFKDFEAKVTGKMGAAEKKEFYELIAHRESYDLENILADPDGRVKRPMKHPQIQMSEAIFEINRLVYETPHDFKEMEAEYENALEIRDRTERNLWLFDPEQRAAKRRQIEKLDRMLDKVMPNLMAYLEDSIAETGKKEVANVDQKKLDAAFAQAAVAHERLFIVYKHTLPHLLKSFTEVALSAYDTPEEIEKFYERIAKREAEELDEILAAVKREKGK